MDLTLKRILKSKTTRRANRGSNQYKKSSGGPCPNTNPRQQMVNSYWYEFGCPKASNHTTRNIRSKQAKACASERMAEMKNHPRTNATANANKSHIMPIKHAYNLGYQCLNDPRFYTKGSYVQDFRKLYNNLILKNLTSPRHKDFEAILGSGEYPLENPTHSTQLYIDRAKVIN